MSRGRRREGVSKKKLLWILVVVVLLVPIPTGDQVWYLTGPLFRMFDALNNQLPENF